MISMGNLTTTTTKKVMIWYYIGVYCKKWKDLTCEILQPFIKPLHQER